jgi:hypothetical protein
MPARDPIPLICKWTRSLMLYFEKQRYRKEEEEGKKFHGNILKFKKKKQKKKNA